ncbi:hypothetical protein RRG08_032543 [Elysia crispata]|uniref:Uncharacterized protein n=1 Tax=Elysia crispata TaxID=231223 RepID=A0AAE0ZXL9_9GAST|nr:hypothetical protein RRG08_032543 [Elysia crispata]
MTANTASATPSSNETSTGFVFEPPSWGLNVEEFIRCLKLPKTPPDDSELVCACIVFEQDIREFYLDPARGSHLGRSVFLWDGEHVTCISPLTLSY